MGKLIKNLCRCLLLLALVFLAALAYGGWQDCRAALDAIPLADKAAAVTEQEHFVAYAQLPEDYVRAVVAVEDRRFWLHNGVDPVSALRAIRNNIRERALVEGGSTISQQLARNFYFTQEKTLRRKAAEAFMALRIEKDYSKEEIFSLYVNSIYFGSGYYCVYDAAMGYFGKEPAQLDLYECTLLAGVPNAPSVYSPDVNPELAEERRQQVLAAMVSCGYLSEAQAVSCTP